MTVRLSALRAGRSLPQGRFLVLISVRDLVDPRAIVRLEGLGKVKNSNYLIGILTGDLPACGVVPQPTTLPRAPISYECRINLSVHCRLLLHASNKIYFTRRLIVFPRDVFACLVSIRVYSG
jgi:hypothetical protein